MNELTIASIAAIGADATTTQVQAQGIDLSQVSQLDLAGLQLLISTFLYEQATGEEMLRGKLAPEVCAEFATIGGFATPPTCPHELDLETFWRQVS